MVAIHSLIRQIEQLRQQCEMPTLSVALKADKDKFRERIPAMVQAALADVTLKTTPRPADGNDIRHLLEELL